MICPAFLRSFSKVAGRPGGNDSNENGILSTRGSRDEVSEGWVTGNDPCDDPAEKTPEVAEKSESKLVLADFEDSQFLNRGVGVQGLLSGR